VYFFLVPGPDWGRISKAVRSISGLRGPANLADFFLFSGIVLMVVFQVRISRRPAIPKEPPALAGPSTSAD
jgi:hypothetical protein